MSDQLEVQSSKRVLLNDVGKYVGKRVRVVGKVQNSTEGQFTLVATDGVTSVTIIIPEHTIDPEVMPIVEVAGLVGDDLSVSAELVCPFIDFGLSPLLFHPSLLMQDVFSCRFQSCYRPGHVRDCAGQDESVP